MLFPVSLVGFQTLKEWECFDSEIGKDSAVEIREYFIPDFSSWKTNHDAYKENFTVSSNRFRRKAARRQQRLKSMPSLTCAQLSQLTNY